MRTSARGLSAVASAALLALIAAPTAQAAPQQQYAPAATLNCPSDGYVTSWDVCTSLSNGTLMLDRNSGGGTYVTVQYEKDAGGTITAELGYQRSGVLHWGGYQSMSAGSIYESDFSPSSSCNSDIGEMYVSSTGSTYQTPPTTAC